MLYGTPMEADSARDSFLNEKTVSLKLTRQPGLPQLLP